MVTLSAFEGFLVPERSRRKAARDGGFAVPAYQERPVELEDAPFLVTNARGSFVQPGVSREKMLRYGFSECPLDEEPRLLAELYRVLWGLSESSGWSNRCTSIAQAKHLLESFGLLPRTLIVPFATLHEVCGQEITLSDANKLILAQGCVAEVGGIRIFYSSLPSGQMILGTAPPLVGIATRIDDHVGLVLQRIHQSVVLINELVR